MKDSQTNRLILGSFRAIGYHPFHIQIDSLRSFHLKLNTSWYILALIITLINFGNVVQVTVQPNWSLKNFHGLVSYTRLILVSLDSFICYMETLWNTRSHVEFFETIAQLDVVLGKFQLKASCKRLSPWVNPK